MNFATVWFAKPSIVSLLRLELFMSITPAFLEQATGVQRSGEPPRFVLGVREPGTVVSDSTWLVFVIDLVLLLPPVLMRFLAFG